VLIFPRNPDESLHLTRKLLSTEENFENQNLAMARLVQSARADDTPFGVVDASSAPSEQASFSTARSGAVNFGALMSHVELTEMQALMFVTPLSQIVWAE
jgi:hypothetical protein